jgi:predicted unusual protein kinase regulating ubiquinone biosynthesis (AarF/ABC1/UbiB family)
MSERDNGGGTPVGRGARFFKLAGMTASVAGNYASNRLKSAFQSAEAAAKDRLAVHQLNGERIAQTLGELKGAAMKIGQMASIGSDVLPRELSDALAKLQKEAPPVSFEVIAAQIESELGAPPQVLFDRFDREPFASASIGQVHRAVTDDGREVIVKVQYPGVDDSVDSDLSHLKFALRASGLVNAAQRKALGKVFEEVRARLHEELDYTNEALNVRRFRAHHARHDFVVVPDVVGERSAKRVLTLTYEASDSIQTVLADGERYPQEVRNTLGRHLFESVTSQIFELRAVQADPNPANYGFREDGRVVLYDFGCVKDIGVPTLTHYRACIRAALDSDWESVERCLIQLGARNTEGPPVPFDYYALWRDIFLDPLMGAQPYDFGASTMHERAVKEVKNFLLHHINSFQPPVELVFVDRAVAGTFGNVRRIGSQADLRHLIDRYIRQTPEGLQGVA